MNKLMETLFCIAMFSVASWSQTQGWGANRHGELGIGNQIQQITPQTITGVEDVTAISGGLSHILFLKADGTVIATGFNNQYQLGDGTKINRSLPVTVKNLTNVVQVSGGWEHSAALKSDGTVWSWGSDRSGQIGNGATESNECQCFSVPTRSYISDVVQIAAGLYHTLALKSDGTVWAWGFNKQGQLGNGTTFDSDVPIQVGAGIAGFDNIIAISANIDNSLALKADGTVWEWGEFEVKTDRRFASMSFPEQNTSLTNVTQISAGDGSNLALKPDGTVWKWGNNLIGKVQYVSTPKDSHWTLTTAGCKCFETPSKINVDNVVDIKSSGWAPGYFLVRKSDGSVWSWGHNDFGQMGNGKTSRDFITAPEQSLVGKGNALIGAGHSEGFAVKPYFMTRAGENMRQYGENVNLKFSKVIKPGTTSYTSFAPQTIDITLPTGLKVLRNAPAYDIKTTAEPEGDIIVCVRVPTVYKETIFSRLHLLQSENNSFVDKTLSADYRTRQLCAQTNSLSQFVIAH